MKRLPWYWYLVAFLLLLAFHGEPQAQNIQCPTRPAGDSSNACASTAFVTNAQGTELVFATKTAAAAATISASVNRVATLGYSSVNDYGGAMYIRTASAGAANYKFQSADGQWWTLFGPDVTPEMFGAVGDDSTNNDAAFASIATWINAERPDARITFTRNAGVYRVWTSSPVAAGVALMDISNTNGLTVDMGNSRITSPATSFSGATYVFLLRDNNNNATFRNIQYRQTAFGNSTPQVNGAQVIQAQGSGSNIYIENMDVRGASVGFAAVRLVGTSNRIRNVTINNAYFFSVFYPMNFQRSGDNFTGVGIYADTFGRLYFPYNVSNHYVSVTANYVPVVNPPIDITTYADSTETAEQNTTSDITVNAKFTSSAALPTGLSYVQTNFIQYSGTTSSATMKNIRLNLDMTANTLGATSYAYSINKLTSAGALDTTTRGYVLDNIVLSGKMDFATGPGTVMSAFVPGVNGTWTGETVRNVGVRDFISVGSNASNSFIWDITGLTGPFFMENVTANVAGSITGGGTNFRPTNVTIPSINDRQTANAGTAPANQFLTGFASSTGQFSAAQPTFSNLSGSATCAQLPALTGDVTTSAGSCATTIANDAVSNAKLADMGAYTIKGNNTNASATPSDIDTNTTSYTPTVTCGAGSGTFSTAGSHTKIGKLVFVSITITVTAIGTCTGSIQIELPYTAAAKGQALAAVGAGGAVANYPNAGRILASGAVVYWFTSTANVPTTNDVGSITGVYEAAS